LRHSTSSSLINGEWIRLLLLCPKLATCENLLLTNFLATCENLLPNLLASIVEVGYTIYYGESHVTKDAFPFQRFGFAQKIIIIKKKKIMKS
jgi:hypothetical protein